MLQSSIVVQMCSMSQLSTIGTSVIRCQCVSLVITRAQLTVSQTVSSAFRQDKYTAALGRSQIIASYNLPALLALILITPNCVRSASPGERWALADQHVTVCPCIAQAQAWPKLKQKNKNLMTILPSFTWSQDIRTALLCYSLLKVHDQAMLTRDGESLVLFSCLWFLDDLRRRNGLEMNLGMILGWVFVNSLTPQILKQG